MGKPNEVAPAVPFAEDYRHAEDDPEEAHTSWQQLVQADRVMTKFRAPFIGKAGPVQFCPDRAFAERSTTNGADDVGGCLQ